MADTHFVKRKKTKLSTHAEAKALEFKDFRKIYVKGHFKANVQNDNDMIDDIMHIIGGKFCRRAQHLLKEELRDIPYVYHYSLPDKRIKNGERHMYTWEVVMSKPLGSEELLEIAERVERQLARLLENNGISVID